MPAPAAATAAAGAGSSLRSSHALVAARGWALHIASARARDRPGRWVDPGRRTAVVAAGPSARSGSAHRIADARPALGNDARTGLWRRLGTAEHARDGHGPDGLTRRGLHARDRRAELSR